VADGNVNIPVVAVNITGGKDENNNAMIDNDNSDAFGIDTQNPTVVSVTPNDALITDADAGAGNFWIDIVFNENMNEAVNPNIAFTPSIATTLTFSSGSWTDNLTYRATYNVADENVENADVDILVENAKDDNGNTQVSSPNADEFTVDTKAPAAPIGLSASPSGSTNVNSFSVSWTNPTDLSGIAGAYYKLDSAPTGPTDGTYQAGTGITSISGISVSGDGSHPIYVWLRDVAGNVNHANRSSTTLNLDTTPPGAPTLLTPANGALTNDDTPSFRWTAVGASYTLQYATDSGFTQNLATVSVSLATNYTPTAGLADGTWYWRVRGTDQVGNVGPWSSTWSFTIDTVAPAAPALSALPGQTNIQTLSVSGTAEANSTVKVYIGDNLAGTTTAGTGGSFNVSVTLSEGSNVITAKATDAAGNTGPASSAQTVVYTVPTGPSKTVENIETGENAAFDFTENGLAVTVVTITVRNTVYSAGVAVENVALPEGVSPPAGVAYSYLQITTNIGSENIESVEIRFQVSRSWINQNGIDPNTIKLYKYQAGGWQALSTTKISDDALYVYYSAQTTSLSLFAVAGTAAPVAPPPLPVMLYVGIILIIVIICLLAYGVVRKMKAPPRRKMKAPPRRKMKAPPR
jgi:PGF-pre-PGF domain-containing protein